MKRVWRRLGPQLLRLLPLAVLLALFLVTEFRGLDFGSHWDELDWQIQPVRDMVQSGLMMPRAAMYPAFARWLVLIPSALHGLEKLLRSGLEPRPIQAAMLHAINGPGYLLQARGVFVVVSSLALVWTYLAALVLGRRPWEALVAACTLGLSWEYAYHSRFVATDCIDVQFSALTLLLVCCFVRLRSPHWLYGAAVAAGLGIGTKFSAGPLLFPVLVAGAWALPVWRWGAQLRRAAALLVVAFAAYVISTPATLLDPFAFVEQLRFISTYYSRGHYGFTVAPGFEHWAKVLLYLAVSYFSPYRAVSIVLFAFVILGAGVWLKTERRVGVLLVGFPLVFLAAVCNRFAVLMVRNYLMVAPFCGLLLARGLASLLERWPGRFSARGFALLLSGVGIANAWWLVRAGESIRERSLDTDIERALADVARRPGERFLVSPAIVAFAKQHGVRLGGNVTRGKAQHVVFLAEREGPNAMIWPANDPFAIEKVFGPLEVNLDWYPTWAGDDRVLMMSTQNARKIGVPFVLSKR